MKKALTALLFLIFTISASATAQDYRLFPPPVKPVYEKIKAEQNVWVYDVRLISTAKGYVFTANVKALFYAGLDDEEKRIPFKFAKNRGDELQDDPSDFELIDEVFSGTAYIKVGRDNNIVARTKFKVTGGLDDKKKAGEKDGVIEFEPIPNTQQLLTTMYTLIVEINPGSQYKFRQYIWVDKEESRNIGAPDGDNIKIVRDDPRRTLAISVDSFVLLRKNKLCRQLRHCQHQPEGSRR